MELKELMEKINNNDVPHFLILFGEEQGVLDAYLNKIKSVVNNNCVSFQYLLDFYKRRGVKSLNNSPKLCIINRDDTYRHEEKLWQEVSQYFSKSKDFVVLRYGTLKKSEKFYIRNKKYCVEFKKLTDQTLLNHVYNNIELSENLALKLIKYCDNDYNRILLEINKIKNYSKELNLKNIDECFKLMDGAGIFHKEIGDITFELTDAILYGDIRKSFIKLDEAKRKGEPAILIASLLYTGFRNMLAVQGLGKNKKDASHRTGLQGWEVHNVMKNLGGYDLYSLERNLKICQKVEAGIKTGNIPENIALDYIVMQCLI